MFATLDPTTRRLRLPREREVIINDTVGFIRDLPPDLIAAFRSTLEEIDAKLREEAQNQIHYLFFWIKPNQITPMLFRGNASSS